MTLKPSSGAPMSTFCTRFEAGPRECLFHHLFSFYIPIHSANTKMWDFRAPATVFKDPSSGTREPAPQVGPSSCQVFRATQLGKCSPGSNSLVSVKHLTLGIMRSPGKSSVCSTAWRMRRYLPNVTLQRAGLAVPRICVKIVHSTSPSTTDGPLPPATLADLVHFLLSTHGTTLTTTAIPRSLFTSTIHLHGGRHCVSQINE